MRPCHAVEITTPKKFVLNGLWFGPKRPKRAIVFVHGLGGSVFSMGDTIAALADTTTAVLAFNNRGHDVVSGLKKAGPFKRVWNQRRYAGSAHEVFTDCIDDIQGAVNFARRTGVRSIYLAGHSTGCQKSVYWAHKKGSGVKGVILLAPVSDYAGALHRHGKKKLERIASIARRMVREGKAHELLPRSLWPEEPDDAQRFLSLYTPESVEEIFPYVQEKRVPRLLRAVRIPTLVVWAGKDEYAERPAEEVVAWFGKHLRGKHRVVIIPRVPHRFTGGEKALAGAIRDFMK